MKKNKLIVISIITTAIILSIGIRLIYAYYTDKSQKINTFKVGEIEAIVREPNYEDNKIVKPNEEIAKDPTFSNIGEVSSYIRAQVYVPVSKAVKYVDSNENIVEPSEEIELLSYKVNAGWELVTEEEFSGLYEDREGNKYKVYTYKFVRDGKEKPVNSGETIGKTLFDKVKVINYLDMDKNTNIKLHVSAIAVQSEGGTADEMWTYYKNQNGTGIVGVEQ